MLARISLVPLIAIAAVHAAAQGITAPVFEGAGQMNNSMYSAIRDAEGNLYYTHRVVHPYNVRDVFDYDPGPGVVPLPVPLTQAMFVLAKVDPERNLEWLKVVPGDTDFEITSANWRADLDVDADGNVIVVRTVYFPEPVDFGEPGNPYIVDTRVPSSIIWKLDAEGRTLWVKMVDERAAFIAVRTAADRSIYLQVGQRGATDLDPGPGVYTFPSRGTIVLKLSPDGNFVWAKKLFYETTTFSFAVGTDGLSYTAFSFIGQIDADPGPGVQLFSEIPSIDGGNTLLVCLDADGNYQWAAQHTRSEPDQLELDGAGGLLLRYGNEEITRFSPTGEFQWTRTIGELSYDDERMIVVGNAGDFYILGHALPGDSIGTSPADMSHFSMPAGTHGMFAARWDLSGTQLWCTLWPGLNFSNPHFRGNTAGGRLLVTAAVGEPVDVDPSSVSQHILTPYISGMAYGMAILALISSDEVWLQFDLAPRQMDGSQAYPLRTLANAVRAIQPGQTINIKGAGGVSSETGTFSKPMTLRAVGGTARIGVQP